MGKFRSVSWIVLVTELKKWKKMIVLFYQQLEYFIYQDETSIFMNLYKKKKNKPEQCLYVERQTKMLIHIFFHKFHIIWIIE